MNAQRVAGHFKNQIISLRGDMIDAPVIVRTTSREYRGLLKVLSIADNLIELELPAERHDRVLICLDAIESFQTVSPKSLPLPSP